MLIFPNARIVLFAVPKTATTALETALAPHAGIVLRNPPGIKHMPLYRYYRHFLPLLERSGLKKLETLAVVREPVSWLGSWFRYRSRPEIAGQPQFTGNIDFDSFVRAYLMNEQPECARVGSQARFLSDESGRPAVDRLFAYEDIGALTGYLGARLGANISLPRRNASPRRPLDLSKQTESLLRRKHATDFALWKAALAGRGGK